MFTCDDGLYCPDAGDSGGSTPGGGDGSTDGGVLMSVSGAGDRTCQECTPLVPEQYQVRSETCASMVACVWCDKVVVMPRHCR